MRLIQDNLLPAKGSCPAKGSEAASFEPKGSEGKAESAEVVDWKGSAEVALDVALVPNGSDPAKGSDEAARGGAEEANGSVSAKGSLPEKGSDAARNEAQSKAAGHTFLELIHYFTNPTTAP